MCILFLAINQHPDYPLIVAANRDEFFDRPSESMHFWPDKPDILAGRDALQGGTWLGISKSGRFCAVTNFRTGQKAKEDAPSRGALVTRFLETEDSEEEFLAFLSESHQSYNPFNLVFGGVSGLSVFTSMDAKYVPLKSGFHSVSNGYVHHQWPKMDKGESKLAEVIANKKTIPIDSLNNIMRDQTKADLEDLPDTGIDQSLEQHLSSIFIQGEEYGTRTTSYLFFNNREILLHELNYDNQASVIEEQQFIQPIV